jgi:TPR repeat protein
METAKTTPLQQQQQQQLQEQVVAAVAVVPAAASMRRSENGGAGDSSPVRLVQSNNRTGSVNHVEAEENRAAIDAIREFLSEAGIVPSRRVTKLAEMMVLEQWLSMKRIAVLFRKNELKRKLEVIQPAIDEEEIEMILDHFIKTPAHTVAELQQQLENTSQRSAEEVNSLRATIIHLQELLTEYQTDTTHEEDRLSRAIDSCKRENEFELAKAKEDLGLLSRSVADLEKTISDNEFEESQLHAEISHLRHQNNELQSRNDTLCRSIGNAEQELSDQRNLIIQRDHDAALSMSALRSQSDKSMHEYELETVKLRNTITEILNQFTDHKTKAGYEADSLRVQLIEANQCSAGLKNLADMQAEQATAEQALLQAELRKEMEIKQDLLAQLLLAGQTAHDLRERLRQQQEEKDELQRCIEAMQLTMERTEQLFAAEKAELLKRFNDISDMLADVKADAAYEADAFRVTVVALQKQLADKESNPKEHSVSPQTQVATEHGEYETRLEVALAEQRVKHAAEVDSLTKLISQLKQTLAEDHALAKHAIEEWSRSVDALQQENQGNEEKYMLQVSVLQSLQADNLSLKDQVEVGRASVDILNNQIDRLTEAVRTSEQNSASKEQLSVQVIGELNLQIEALRKELSSFAGSLSNSLPISLTVPVSMGASPIQLPTVYRSKFNTPSPSKRVVHRRSPTKTPFSVQLALSPLPPTPFKLSPTQTTKPQEGSRSLIDRQVSDDAATAAKEKASPVSTTSTATSATKQRILSRLSSKLSLKPILSSSSADPRLSPSAVEKLFLKALTKDQEAYNDLLDFSNENNEESMLATSFCVFLAHPDAQNEWHSDMKKSLSYFGKVKDWLLSYRDKGEGSEEGTNSEVRAYAQLNLGKCYAMGIGVGAVDNVEASRLFRLAAEAGLGTAQYNLGICYEHGIGMAVGMLEALRWYEKAADSGDKDAQYVMGKFLLCLILCQRFVNAYAPQVTSTLKDSMSERTRQQL